MPRRCLLPGPILELVECRAASPTDYGISARSRSDCHDGSDDVWTRPCSWDRDPVDAPRPAVDQFCGDELNRWLHRPINLRVVEVPADVPRAVPPPNVFSAEAQLSTFAANRESAMRRRLALVCATSVHNAQPHRCDRDDPAYHAAAGSPTADLALSLLHFVMFHLFSGPRRTGDLQWHVERQVSNDVGYVFVLPIDICINARHGNMCTATAKARLLAQCYAKQIIGMQAEPPCETWTAARDRADGGLTAVRTGDTPWWILTISRKQRTQVRAGSNLLRAALDFVQAMIITGGAAVLEHPAFPTWSAAASPASIWRTDAVKLTAEHPDVQVYDFDQCVTDQIGRKPTSLMLVRLPSIFPQP